MKHIAIIGAGIGGLTAALRLRRAGFDVTLFEKNEQLGGKVSRCCWNGFTFDLGPTVLTMPFVLRELLESVGAELDELIDLAQVEPTCRYHWSDGTRFDAFADPERRRAELDRVFPEDMPSVEALLADAEQLYEATKEVFLFNRFEGVRELVRPRNLRMLSRIRPSSLGMTLAAALRRRLRSEKLIQLFSRFATYNGSSPYRAPAMLNVIAHVELGLGAWYPTGGMYTITEALATVARDIGVEIHTSTPVEAVEREGKRITSVSTETHRYPVDAVISNVDVLWTYRHLLDPTGIATPRTVATSERSCSGFLIVAAVRGTHSELSHHNIFFSDDYPDEFADIFDHRRLPRAMTIYLSISSRSDPNMAPPGCENWYILVNAPAAGIEHNDAAALDRYEAAVWARLRQFGLTPDVLWQSRLTPIDIEQRYNSVDGAIYGTSSNSLLSAFVRPRNSVPGLGNLYAAGGSAHPGGGVPLVILSGRITADLVIEDLRDQGKRA